MQHVWGETSDSGVFWSHIQDWIWRVMHNPNWAQEMFPKRKGLFVERHRCCSLCCFSWRKTEFVFCPLQKYFSSYKTILPNPCPIWQATYQNSVCKLRSCSLVWTWWNPTNTWSFSTMSRWAIISIPQAFQKVFRLWSWLLFSVSTLF